MTKSFRSYLMDFKLDQETLPEFRKLKENIVAFEGQKMFEFLEEGTTFKDQGILNFKSQNPIPISYEDTLEKSLKPPSPMNRVTSTNW